MFRMLTGKQLFQGIIGSTAKVKALTETAEKPKYANQFKAKFSALVVAASNDDDKKSLDSAATNSTQYKIEHCQVKFVNEDDRTNFITVFNEVITAKNAN